MAYCPFRKFKNAFGIPNKGIHAYRVVNTAVVDYILTIIAALATSFVTKVPLVLTTLGWFMGGVIAHILFGVKTSTLQWIGIRC